MKKQPFFSFCIPTRNRVNELDRALKSIFMQSFSSYEIIIGDNSTNQLTKTLCTKYNDRRLSYYQNKTNIGFTCNLHHTFSLAKGQYIFTLGDDDWLSSPDLLTNIHQQIIEKHYGFIRIAYLFQDRNNRNFSLFLKHQENVVINEKENNLIILDFLDRVNYYSLSGLVFKRSFFVPITAILKHNNRLFDMSDFWLKYLFRATKEQGALFWFKTGIFFTWSDYQLPTFYHIRNDHIPKESVWKLLKNDLSKKEMNFWIKKESIMLSKMLPSIKFYSDNLNLIAFTKRLLVINPELKHQPHFYFGLLIGLLMPKKLWYFLRCLYLRTKWR